MKRNLLLVIFVCLILSAVENLPDQFTRADSVTLVDKIANLGFSPDQKLLVVLQKQQSGSFIVYDGIRLNNKQTISIQDANLTASPTSFAFTHDSSMLLIGTIQGRVYGFQIIDGAIKHPFKHRYSAVPDNSTQKNISSISVSAENIIAIGAKTQIITLGIPPQETVQFVQLARKDIIDKVNSLVWSPKENNIILVGGTALDNNGTFGVYDTVTKNLTMLNNKNTLSVAFFPDGNTIVQAAQAQNIKLWSYADKSEVATLDKTLQTSQLLISANGLFLGAQVKSTNLVLGWKIQFTAKPLNLINNQQIQQIAVKQALNQTGQNLAFTQDGSQLLIISVGSPAIIPRFTICGLGQFLQNNECINCTGGCKSCYNAQICLSCDNTKYLQNDVCTACNTALPGCNTCSDKANCLSCDDTKDWKPTPNPDTHVCECADKYVNDGGNCVLCSDRLLDCDTCTDVETCKTCKDVDNFDPTPNTQNKCICRDGWILDGQVCKACSDKIIGCTSCSDANTCKVCDDAKNFVLNANLKCQCKSTFYLNDKQCDRCDTVITDCAKCLQDGSKCIQCQTPAKQPSQDGTICQCRPTYYQDQAGACQFCDTVKNDRCLRCQTTGDHKCLSCNPDGHWNAQPNAQGKCTCQQGYYESNNQCIVCQVKGCDACPTPTTCTDCSAIRHFKPVPKDQNTCECADNYYPDDAGEQCFGCGQKIDGCLQCTDLKTCTKCDDVNHFVLDDVKKDCICQPTYYKNARQCSLCSIPLKYCSECIVDNACLKCQDGFDLDTDTNKCIGCQGTKIGCLQCSNKDTCKTCNAAENFVPDEAGTGCQCKASFHPKQKGCQACSVPLPGCIECDATGATCSKCDEAGNYVLNVDKCVCKEGYHPDGIGGCQLCSTVIPGCQTCTNDGTSTICQKCQTEKHFVKVDTTCVCVTQYYLDVQECKLCSQALDYCLTCKKSTECDSCKNTFTLNTETKKCQCAGDNKQVNNDGNCVDKQSGLSTLAIIAIIVGVLALAGGAVAIIKCCKKRQSPLEDDQYEALEGQK